MAAFNNNCYLYLLIEIISTYYVPSDPLNLCWHQWNKIYVYFSSWVTQNDSDANTVQHQIWQLTIYFKKNKFIHMFLRIIFCYVFLVSVNKNSWNKSRAFWNPTLICLLLFVPSSYQNDVKVEVNKGSYREDDT